MVPPYSFFGILHYRMRLPNIITNFFVSFSIHRESRYSIWTIVIIIVSVSFICIPYKIFMCFVFSTPIVMDFKCISIFCVFFALSLSLQYCLMYHALKSFLFDFEKLDSV